MHSRVALSRSKSRWFRCLLIVVVFGGWVGMYNLCAGDPVSTEAQRLKGDLVSVDFLHRGKNKPSELFACDKNGLVKVYDIAGKEQRRWTVGGGLEGVLRFTISSEMHMFYHF